MRIARWALAGCVCVGLAACGKLPPLGDRIPSSAFLDTDDTALGRAIAPRAAQHRGRSGVYPLLDSYDAFSARVLLARGAERSLDVQYYIWERDLSGTLLFQALHEAAQRGVRVRLLLDDNNTAGLDPTLAALDAHPNIEVRLFNPFVVRNPRWIGYLTDFSRLNRRMHNKSYTADNQATIVGGRNIGDAYFAAATGEVFVDLDVLVVGPAVRDVSRDFDTYWSSASAYPVERIVSVPTAPLRLDIDADAAAAYIERVGRSPFGRDLLDGRLPVEWTAMRMVSDDPAKALGAARAQELLPEQLEDLLGRPQKEVDLVSAYFVPAEAGTRALTAMARRGVKVRVLTNALHATDVPVVHAGYAKRRAEMLQAGLVLYEFRAAAQPPRSRERTFAGGSGSSDASLHAKTFVVDRERVFIGSFNFDPRSAHLNTEMGFVIESPSLAGSVAHAFATRVPFDSYEARLSDAGDLFWIERRAGEQVRHNKEPGTTVWQRLSIRLLSLLPIEWLL